MACQYDCSLLFSWRKPIVDGPWQSWSLPFEGAYGLDSAADTQEEEGIWAIDVENLKEIIKEAVREVLCEEWGEDATVEQ